MFRRQKPPQLEAASDVPEQYNATSLDAGSTHIKDLWTMLTSTSEGLTTEEAKSRLELYGANELKQAPPVSIWACKCYV